MKLMNKINQLVSLDSAPKPATMIVENVFMQKGIMYGKVGIEGKGKVPVKCIGNGVWIDRERKVG